MKALRILETFNLLIMYLQSVIEIDPYLFRLIKEFINIVLEFIIE